MSTESPAVETLAEIRNIVLRYAEPITASGRASLNETVAALAAYTQQAVDAALLEAADEYERQWGLDGVPEWLRTRGGEDRGGASCSCGAPGATSLTPGEVLVHRCDGRPCYIGDAS